MRQSMANLSGEIVKKESVNLKIIDQFERIKEKPETNNDKDIAIDMQSAY